MKKPIECRTMREIFSTPKRWTKYREFAGKDGNDCHRSDAQSCCLVGALSVIHVLDYNEAQVTLLQKIKEYSKGVKRLSRLRFKSVPGWNDHKRVKFEDVRAVVRMSCL